MNAPHLNTTRLATAALALLFALPTGATADTAALKPVRVTSVKVGHGYHIVAKNRSVAPVTISLKFELNNMRLAGPHSDYVVVPANSERRIAQVVRKHSGQAYKFNYKFSYKWGTPDAAHDEAALYRLPLQTGYSAKILQGYEGKFSHQGTEAFAIDWALPEGTVICAAREGIVIEAFDQSRSTGTSKAHKKQGNYVRILHADGTIASYDHLQTGHVNVFPGQRVKVGQRLALSGNTGYSTTPHLHFEVYAPIDGYQRQTIKVQFITAGGVQNQLEEGSEYTVL